MKKQNTVAFILQFLALVILLIGIFTAFIVENFMVVFSTFVFVMILFGLAEIINLLQGIFFQLKGEGSNEDQANNVPSSDNGFYTIIPLTEEEKNLVYELFEHQKKRDVNIISSPIKRHCIVSVKKKHYGVYVDENNAEILTDVPEELVEWAKVKKGISL